ncbi:deacetylase, partial [bacterium]|nr:deacetylase [bacterium]
MFIVIKKKVLIVFSLLFVIIIAASIFFAVSDISAWAAKKNRLLPIYSVATEEKTVALTFDAAWGADKTRNIVKILNDN